ncbi:MAG: hypothetical protein QOG61_2388 [Candidatus Binataceae bacterium]|jgi:hypothetical protein|nr:hypothetical protein [Candidatus Binataceae bacterium]
MPRAIDSTNDRAAADVYAGDNSDFTRAHGESRRVFSYAIEADAEPDVLARVANLFNLANCAPKYVTLRTNTEAQVTIFATIGPLDPVNAEMICRKIRQLTCVIAARLSEGEVDDLEWTRKGEEV